MLFNDRRGYTLTELIVVMVIFMAIIMISSTAFMTIINRSSQQSKSAETQIEGIVGLELLRADLEHAGFGLPWDMGTATYQEVAAISDMPVALITPATWNDASDPPRALLSDDSTFNTGSANVDGSTSVGSKYLIIKSAIADSNAATKKWSTISIDRDGVRHRTEWGDAERDFAGTDRVVIVENLLNSTPVTRQLVTTGTAFSGTFANYSSPPSYINGDSFEIYGIDSATNLRMPFNRADYYIKRPDKMPSSCSSSSRVGVLYKATLNHADGKFTNEMPLLDCVADMQIVYGLDTNGDGRVGQYFESPTNLALTAENIRNQLREIRVYILAQEGKKDTFFSYKSDKVLVGEVINGIERGRQFSLASIGSDYKNYRWKVYTIVVRPKNLIQ